MSWLAISWYLGVARAVTVVAVTRIRTQSCCRRWRMESYGTTLNVMVRFSGTSVPAGGDWRVIRHA